MRYGKASILLIIGLLASVSAGSAAIAGCAAPDHPGGEWPIYGHDLLNHRNQTAENTIGIDNVEQLEPAWIFNVAAGGGVGTIEASPIVADGCVYVSTQGGWIFALNADTGTVVWSKQMGSTVTTLSVANGRVFADVSFPNEPVMAALDQETGDILWETTLATMRGSDATGSPVAFEDMVATGVSCIGAEAASGQDRFTCRGAFVILRQTDGVILATGFGIPDEDFAIGYAGGGIWGVPAIDTAKGFAYVGAGNPFSAREHARTNAVLKIDVDPLSDTFGTVVGSYKATPEQYVPVFGAYKPVCDISPNFATCEEPDFDVAQAASILTNERGQEIGVIGQGSGITHAFRTDTMEISWEQFTGPPYSSARGGGMAYDGTHVFQVGGMPSSIWAMDPDDGSTSWIAPAGAGTNTHNPVAYANGVVYIPGGTIRPQHLFGVPSMPFLTAIDAETGEVLLNRPLAPDIQDVGQGTVAGGVIVARNTVLVPVNGATLGGFIAAYRLPT
ncbi:MAG TPA: PQQ-binding-like beta-propeller repeat protein [Actinomycetota bacterium]